MKAKYFEHYCEWYFIQFLPKHKRRNINDFKSDKRTFAERLVNTMK